MFAGRASGHAVLMICQPEPRHFVKAFGMMPGYFCKLDQLTRAP